MLLRSGIVLGIVVGLARGGRFSRLAELEVRGLGLLLAAFLVQVAIFASPLAGTPVVRAWGPVLYTLSLDVILLTLLYNYRLGWPFWFVILGTLLNFLVISQNGGHMPVSLELYRQVRGEEAASALLAGTALTHLTPATDETALALLSDWIVLPLPAPLGNVYSIGDVLIALGLGLFLAAGLAHGRREPAPRPACVPTMGRADGEAG